MNWNQIVDTAIKNNDFKFFNSENLDDHEVLARRLLGFMFQEDPHAETWEIFFIQFKRLSGIEDLIEVTRFYKSALDWWTEAYTGRY